MVKQEALTELTLSALEAFHYGNQGRIARGYLLLTSGLVRARGAADGEAQQLVELWEAAMEQFRRSFPNDGYFDGL